MYSSEGSFSLILNYLIWRYRFFKFFINGWNKITRKSQEILSDIIDLIQKFGWCDRQVNLIKLTRTLPCLTDFLK